MMMTRGMFKPRIAFLISAFALSVGMPFAALATEAIEPATATEADAPTVSQPTVENGSAPVGTDNEEPVRPPRHIGMLELRG